MNRRAVKIVSIVMLFVFLAGVAPKEYIHSLLFEHTDTVHEVYKKGELVISGKHTHCSFLGFVLAPFIAGEAQVLIFGEQTTHSACPTSAYHCHFFSRHRVVSMRGPPALS